MHNFLLAADFIDNLDGLKGQKLFGCFVKANKKSRNVNYITRFTLQVCK